METAHSSGLIAMSGATGFVGLRLSLALRQAGWSVVALGRQELSGGVEALAERLRGVRGIINLAGAPILGRWTSAYKKTLVDSRVGVTQRLVEAMALLPEKPGAFVSTSAVGYYASGLHRHTEADHVPAADFLGRLTRDWEHEALRARALGIRTVIFRLGVVLGSGGGALKQMLPPFRWGLGGVIGDGSQAFSWVHGADLIAAYLQALTDPDWQGVYNLTAPTPTTNAGLTRALGEALGRPTWFSAPACLLALRFGEGASVLTRGQAVIPERLLAAGFNFTYTTIEQAVRQCLAA